MTDPKDGDLYMFDISQPSRTQWETHIARDGYRWRPAPKRIYNGTDWVTQVNYIIHKTEDGKDTSKTAFKRFVYADARAKRVIVHYSGDEGALRKFPHGNTKSGKGKEFVPTSKKIMELIEEAGHSATTREILANMRGQFGHGILEDIVAPRDANQIRYVRRQLRAEHQLNQTEKHNADTLAQFWGGNVVRQMTIAPDIQVHLMTEGAVQEIARLASFKVAGTKPLLFHYDTTFNCGAYYVSTLSMRHDLMKHTHDSKQRGGSGEPIVPVAFMVHQTRPTHLHRDFLQKMDFILNEASKGDFRAAKKVLVTDREFPEGIWPGVPTVYCWRHLSQNIDRYVKNKAMSTEDGKLAQESFFRLANSKSQEDYRKNLDQMVSSKRGPWANPVFSAYMQVQMGKTLAVNTGKWHLEKLNLEHIERGMTNNAAEGANNALKSWLRIQNRFLGESTNKFELYSVMQACKRYSDVEFNKIARAYYCKPSEYRLKTAARPVFAMDPKTMPPLPPIENPHEVIKEINTLLEGRPFRPAQDNLSQDPGMDPVEKAKLRKERNKGVEAAARELYKTKVGDVLFIPEGKFYRVTDRFHQTFDVFVGDRNECSCPSEGYCAHILVVKYCYGLADKLEVPDTSTFPKRIPAPRHPSTKRKYKIGGKKPQPTDKFDDALPEQKSKKAKKEVDPEPSETLKERVNTAISISSQGNTTTTSIYSSELEEEALRNMPKDRKTMTRFQKMTVELAKGMANNYTSKQIADIFEEQRIRCKNLRKIKQKEQASILKHTPNTTQLARLLELNDASNRDKRLRTNNFRFNHIKLNEGETHLLTRIDGSKYGFYCMQRDKVIVYGQKKYQEAMQFAARAIQHYKEPITVEFFQTNNPEVDCQTRVYDANKVSFDLYTTVCYCREPETMTHSTPEDFDRDFEVCKSCEVPFHKRCLPTGYQEPFECALHHLPTTGFQWSSGKIANTCPVDNFATALLLENYANPVAFLEHITTNTKYADEALQLPPRKTVAYGLRQLVEAGSRGEYDKAIEAWSEVLQQNSTLENAEKLKSDFYGSETERVYKIIKEGGQYVQEATCTRCFHKETHGPKWDNFSHEDGTVLYGLMDEIQNVAYAMPKCAHCVNGLEVISGLLIRDLEYTPWFLRIELDVGAYRIRELNWCPKTIKLSHNTDNTYKLAYFTIASHNHFTAIMNFEGQLLRYDGMKANRFSLIDETELHQDYKDYVVQSVTFFKDWSDGDDPRDDFAKRLDL